MVKRLTYEFVKKQFEKEGYTLLSKKYQNARQKLKFICPNNHEHEIKYGDFKQGCRCKFCSKFARPVTYEVVKEIAEKKEFELISQEDEFDQNEIEIKCNEGHIIQTTYNNLRYYGGCAECSGTKKHTISFIKKEFKKVGFELISTKYKNSNQKLKYKCKNGHVNKISYTHFRNGIRCSLCSKKKKTYL